MSDRTQLGRPQPTQGGPEGDAVQAYYRDLWERKQGPAPLCHRGRGLTRTDIASRLLRPATRLLDV